jgi:hypothetical protein
MPKKLHTKKKTVFPQLGKQEIEQLANFDRALAVFRKRQNQPEPRPFKVVTKALRPIRSKSLERYNERLREDWLVLNDKDPARVIELPQVKLNWVDGAGRERTCHPHFLLTLLHSRKRPCLVSVLSEHEIIRDPKTLQTVYAGSMAISEVKGWSFKVVTDRDIRTEFLNNIYFLSRFNQMEPAPDKIQILLSKLRKMKRATPRTLIAGCAKGWQEQACFIPMLWYLLSRQEIETDYTKALNMEVPIRLGRCHRK